MQYNDESVELEYYKREQISPVDQDISNIKKHFEIRANLYRMLGVLPGFFKDKNVLEIGPGSGHNSIYNASLYPNKYVLVEPNPAAQKNIIKNFNNLQIKHTQPILLKQTLEEFDGANIFEIGICEGWLGASTKYEKRMIKKLSSFIKINGVLIITLYSSIGGLSTFLRRLMGYRLFDEKLTFKKRTNILVKAYETHLETLASMARSHKHWVQDSILNPHIYVGISSPRLFMKALGNKFKIYQSVPKFNTEWRWYKSIFGDNAQLNENFLDQYNEISHCLIDYRINNSSREKAKNIDLESYCNDLSEAAQKNEHNCNNNYIKYINPILTKIMRNLENDIPKRTIDCLREVQDLLSNRFLKIGDVRNMKKFRHLFGREQCYLSFTKN